MDRLSRDIFIQLIPGEMDQTMDLVNPAQDMTSVLTYSFFRAVIDYENKHGGLLAQEIEEGTLSEQDEHRLMAYINLLIMDPKPLKDKDVFRHVAKTDIELEEKVQVAETRTKFQVYKINADFRTLTFGLFKRIDPDILRWFDFEREDHIGYGKAYYSMASAYGSELKAVSEKGLPVLLDTVSNHYEQIIDILSIVGRNYLNLTSELSPGERFHLWRSIRTEIELPMQEDALLGQLSYLMKERDTSPSTIIEREIDEVKSKLAIIYTKED